MKKNTKKTLTTLFAIILLAISTFTITLSITNAHDPAWEITSYPFVVAAPNTVGVGQTVSVIMWVDAPMPRASMGNDIRRHDYKLTITKPDGTTDIEEWPIVYDTTSLQFYQFNPDQIGIYILDFDYAGQVYTWNSSRQEREWENDVFLPGSTTTNITVQEEPIPNPIGSYPLPTEYWTRPIEGQNTDWWKISSNWLNEPHIKDEPEGRYQMNGAAPNSAHIMWTKPIDLGGVVGGTKVGPTTGQMYYTGSNYDVIFENPIIMNGKFYFSLPMGPSEDGGGYLCVDLLTGEEIWWKDIPVPSFGQILDYNTPNQHGAVGGFLWSSSGRGIQTWNATDPLTGESFVSVTDVPNGYEIYGPNGEILRYMLDPENKWLACWNTTEVIGSGSGGRRQSYPIEYNATDGYYWNITISDLPPGDWDIERGFYNDLLLCVQGTPGSRTHSSQPIESEGANITAISLKESNIGDILWTEYYPPPESIYREIGSVDPENRIFVFRDKESLNLWGYDLDSGNLVWGPVQQSSSGWDYFHASMYNYAAYGNLYTAGMDGIIECFNITTGELKWRYGNGGPGNSTFGGLNSPFGNYPINIGAVADGKLFTFVFEHTADSPIYKGYTVRGIDAYTGEELWQIDSFVTAGGGGARGALWPSLAIADGYMVYLNGYDMQIYCIGKGPSKITAQTPLTAVTLGSNVMITGSVIDISAGTTQDEQRTRFPNGVPVVSDESMGSWMEYVYMHRPMPQDVTGVLVKFEAIDPNNNYQFLGTTTTDMFGNYGLSYEPEVPGGYMIIATFEGSESYYGSTTTAYLVADPAPTPSTSIEPEEPVTPQEESEEPEEPTEPEELTEPEEPTEPEQPTEAPLISTEVAIVAVVAIASIIGVAAYWLLRRK